MGNFTGLEKEIYLPVKNYRCYSSNQSNDQNPGRVLCSYLANQEHCAQTPQPPAAFPNKLLRKVEQNTRHVRTGSTDPSCAALTPSRSSQGQACAVELGSAHSGPSSSDKFYPDLPFPPAMLTQFPVSASAPFNCGHVFLPANIATASSRTSSETPTPPLQRFHVITSQPALATSELIAGGGCVTRLSIDHCLPQPITVRIVHSRY